MGNKHGGILEHHLGLAGTNPGSAFRVVQMRQGLFSGGFAHLSPLHQAALLPGSEAHERLLLPPLPPHLPPGLRLDENTGENWELFCLTLRRRVLVLQSKSIFALSNF